jgi:hypothetical protein
MNRRQFIASLVGGAVAASVSGRAWANDLSPEYRIAADKGLAWLASQQLRDGHWEANNGMYPTAMTGLAGISLLMEGSTLREGRYAENLRRAVDYLIKHSQTNGLIGDPNNAREAERYTYGHGYAILFLASVIGEEEDADRRMKLELVLTKAVEFCGRAQTSKGGWGYVSAADGQPPDFDEGSTTITQLQALRAARDAGIVVPSSIIDKARKYLKESTTEKGNLIYSLSLECKREGTVALVAAALAGGFSMGEYKSDLPRRWLRYCQAHLPAGGDGPPGHVEYTHYYYAQVMYQLGEDGYGELFPDSRPEDRPTWSKYRQARFAILMHSQAPNGSWDSHFFNLGPVYATSMYLTVLQLDKGTLPFYQR